MVLFFFSRTISKQDEIQSDGFKYISLWNGQLLLHYRHFNYSINLTGLFFSPKNEQGEGHYCRTLVTLYLSRSCLLFWVVKFLWLKADVGNMLFHQKSMFLPSTFPPFSAINNPNISFASSRSAPAACSGFAVVSPVCACFLWTVGSHLSESGRVPTLLCSTKDTLTWPGPPVHITAVTT